MGLANRKKGKRNGNGNAKTAKQVENGAELKK